MIWRDTWKFLPMEIRIDKKLKQIVDLMQRRHMMANTMNSADVEQYMMLITNFTWAVTFSISSLKNMVLL